MVTKQQILLPMKSNSAQAWNDKTLSWDSFNSYVVTCRVFTTVLDIHLFIHVLGTT